MSASAKKKLRKELNAAKIEEKQRKEKKETRKQKTTTAIFVAVLAVVLVAAIAIGVVSGVKNSGIIEKNTIAATVGDHKISSLDFSFYYTDLISNTYNQWANEFGDNMELYMMFMGLDLAQPLDAQPHPEDASKTWADYFIDSALDRAKSEYTLYDMAMAEGHTLTEEEQAELDSGLTSLDLIAMYSGYGDTESYLFANYGPGATLEAYTEYCTRSSLATSYYNAHADSLSFDDAAIRAYEEGKELDYTSFSYASYYVNCAAYLTGGTEDAEGTMVYTDAEREAAREAAETVANQLSGCKTVEALDKAIAALPANASNPTAASSHFEDSLYTAISTTISTWLAEEERVNGDTTVIPLESTTDGVTTVSGYYVVLFEGRNENERHLANVRHLLVSFVSESGSSNYTDAEKAAAKAEAEQILADLKAAGTITEDAFAAKVTELTDDTASKATGGLYTDILPVQGIYEEAFTDWSVDPARKAGDTGIIETSYGYHIMYYVGDSALSYRDHLISQDLLADEMDAWYTGILEKVTVEKLDLSHLKTDIILAR